MTKIDWTKYPATKAYIEASETMVKAIVFIALLSLLIKLGLIKTKEINK